MPSSLSATPISPATLSASAEALIPGFFPGPDVYPGSDLYPGKGSTLAVAAAAATTLSVNPA